VIENILNRFGYYKKNSKNEYQEIEYAVPGNPDDNSKRLLELVTDGHSGMQGKSKRDYEFIGVFFTLVILIEYKITQLLVGFDPEVESKMFGKKIDVFKDFLKVYEPEEGEDIQDYRNLISPLQDIKRIRNEMAHDISKPKFKYSDIKHIASYAQKMRPDLFEQLNDCKDQDDKCIVVIGIFGIVFAVEIAKLRSSLV